MAAALTAEALRCFIGLPLPPAHMRALDLAAGRLAGALASRIGFTRPENWHLTLRFLGDVAPEALPGLKQALAGVRLAPFELELGAAGCFPPLPRTGRGRPPQTLWVGLSRGVENCAALASDINQALARAGFPPEDRPLRPHVTLGRVRAPRPEDDWRAALASLDFSGPGPARVGRFTLWRSVLGPGGPRYQALAAFS